MLSSNASGTAGGPIAAAAQWVQGALLGSVATAIAVIAVAAIGFLMLTGRLELRRSATVVLGFFVLFGASTIATALQSSVQGDAPIIVEAVPVVEPPAVAEAAPPPQVPAQSDPYAGASLPRNR